MLKDYECECGIVAEYKKEYKIDFPETIKCPQCGKDMQKRMKKGSLGAIIVPEYMRSSLDYKY